MTPENLQGAAPEVLNPEAIAVGESVADGVATAAEEQPQVDLLPMGNTEIAAEMGAASHIVEEYAISLRVPMAKKNIEGFAPNRIEISLSFAQRKMLCRVFDSLHNSGYKRANNQHVDKRGHVLQWILDQLIELEANATT